MRSKIWDYLHQYEKRTPLPDVDVIFFDKHQILTDEEEQVFRVEIKFKKGSGDLTYNSRYVSRRFNQQDVPKREESSKKGDVFVFVPD